MRTKTLVLFRSKSTGFEEGKMEKAPVLDPRTIWEPSTAMEEKIQALSNHRLLRPKTEVGWRPTTGEEFPTEGTDETVVFLAHIERGSGSRWVISSVASSSLPHRAGTFGSC
jgi:hypothetical protein